VDALRLPVRADVLALHRAGDRQVRTVQGQLDGREADRPVVDAGKEAAELRRVGDDGFSLGKRRRYRQDGQLVEAAQRERALDAGAVEGSRPLETNPSAPRIEVRGVRSS